MKLIIGNKNYSSWSLRPWLLLREHAISFEEIRIALFEQNTYQELAKYTDAAKVPVLHDGELAIWDSLAICEYISETYLKGSGWPVERHIRAEARSISCEMHSGFYAIRENMPMNVRAVDRAISVSVDMQIEISRIDQIWTTTKAKYSQQGPWLFGEFSIADCMFAPMVFRFHTYNIVVSDAARNYMQFVMSNTQLKIWQEQSLLEMESLPHAELGL